MPPVRTAPTTHKLAQRTERSHEENQERAYIAASRRSDRSLEARVESARRASEIHKKRTGRALRVREEDVVNEEMYEEEDDELSQQMRRMNALHPGFTSFSDRLNSYMAGHLGIRSALQQAIIQANQYNAQQLANPMMQANMSSPQGVNHLYNNMPQSPWAFANLPANRSNSHTGPTSIASPQGQSDRQSPTTGLHERRTSSSTQMLTSHDFKSPSLTHSDSSRSSHPSTPYDAISPKPSQSPTQASTLPRSGQASLPYTPKIDAAPRAGQRSYSQSPNSQIAPLTTRLPVETQQLFDGSQQTFNQNFFPDHLSPTPLTSSIAPYQYHSGDNFKPRADSFSIEKSTAGGLDQTLSPPNIDYNYSSSTFPEPHSATFSADDLDPFHDLGMGSDPDFGVDYDQIDFGSGSDGDLHAHGCVPMGSSGEPAWNPDDFFNFGQAE